MRRLIPLLLAVLLFSGCVRTGAQDASAFAPTMENRLVIFTTHDARAYSSIIEEFEQRTGIWVEVKADGSSALLERIAGGKSGCDLMLGGGVENLSAYRSCFAPYVSEKAAAIAPEYDLGNGAWAPFSAFSVVLIYNPKLVRQNLPTGWSSLFDPGWRGRVAFADPAASDAGYSALCTLLQAYGGETDRTLAALTRSLSFHTRADSGDVVKAVADGSCYVGAALEADASKAIADGQDVAIVYPAEGTIVLPDGAAVVRDCAHEENARAFIDFLLLPETQRQLTDGLYRRSVLEESGAVPYDLERAVDERESVLRVWSALIEEGAG